jgi:hypothetical protein
VNQEDVFYSMLTVSETLGTASHLMLPGDMAEEHKAALVDALVRKLGLAKVRGRGSRRAKAGCAMCDEGGGVQGVAGGSSAAGCLRGACLLPPAGVWQLQHEPS